MKRLNTLIIVLAMLPSCNENTIKKPTGLLMDFGYNAVIEENDGFVTISNGLISRTLSLSPDGPLPVFQTL